jgi:hypothetical protein
MSSLPESQSVQAESSENSEQSQSQESQSQPQQPNLTEIPITSENVALNVMVMFLNLAQNRGCYRIDESAKIYECIKMFTKTGEQQQDTPSVSSN